MKKTFFVSLLTSITVVFAFSQILPKEYILGKWQGWQKPNLNSREGFEYEKFNFLDDTHMVIVDSSGSQEVCTYLLDRTKYPVWLDINKPNSTLKGIIVILAQDGFAYYVRTESGEIDHSKPVIRFINERILPEPPLKILPNH